LGNDLNDLEMIMCSKYSAVPHDSHSILKDKASFVSLSDGGDGFVRDVLESLMNFNNLDIDILMK